MISTPQKSSNITNHDKPSLFKSNFSFISEKNPSVTKSQTHLESFLVPYSKKPVYRSCDRSILKPNSTDQIIDEYDKLEFGSNHNSLIRRENSIICPPSEPQNLLNLPKSLKTLLKLTKKLELLSPFTLTPSSPILLGLILSILDILDRNIALKLCLNEFWTIISKHLFYDKPVQFINNLTSLSNRKQKVILWILIKIYEHKVEDLLNLLLEEEDLKVLFKPNCKLLVFKEEILKAFLMLSSFEFSLNFKITQKYEEFLQEPKTSCFSFHFSKYIKDSGIDFSKESLREDDPITLWQQKSKTLNFNEFQMKILKKETEEITDLIHDSDFLSNFLLKYYNNTTSSKNSFESQLNKHKLFLTTLTENMHKKDPLNQKELLDKKNSFLMDFALVKKDFLQRLENINYLKSHTYPNNYQKEEDDINSILTHLEYLFSFLDQIFNESENFSNEIQLDYNNHHNKEDEGEGIEDEKNLIMELDYNRISNSNMVYTYSPGTSLSQGFLKKSNTIGNNDSRIMRKKRSHLFLTSYQYNDKKFKEKPLLPTTIADQNNQCYKCRQYISSGFFWLGNNAVFCYYTGFWYCLDCIAVEERVIPYKAIEEFDFNEYRVSKESRDEIDLLYDKFLINMPYTSPLLSKHQEFYEFMILKRETHLMYDMICDEKLMENLLKDRMNLLVKENIFSLKNLNEIFDGSLKKLLENCQKFIIMHFDSCQHCRKKGSYCKICNSILKVYAFDIRNSEICPICKTLYHLKCFQTTGCEVCHLSLGKKM